MSAASIASRAEVAAALAKAVRTGHVVRMKPAEAPAKRIIEGVEAGARMVYREERSVRTHDFDLHRTAGRVAAVEVTAITDGVVLTPISSTAGQG